MKRPSKLRILVLGLTLLTMVGCGDDNSTGPNLDGDFDELFSPDEVEVVESNGSTIFRLLDPSWDKVGGSLPSDETKAKLDKFAAVFRAHPERSYSVEGHTDSRGAARYNLDLTQRRARNCHEYLITEVGAPESRTSYVGHGEGEPLDSAATEHAWRRNRRIEIIMLPVE